MARSWEQALPALVVLLALLSVCQGAGDPTEKLKGVADLSECAAYSVFSSQCAGLRSSSVGRAPKANDLRSLFLLLPLRAAPETFPTTVTGAKAALVEFYGASNSGCCDAAGPSNREISRTQSTWVLPCPALLCLLAAPWCGHCKHLVSSDLAARLNCAGREPTST